MLKVQKGLTNRAHQSRKRTNIMKTITFFNNKGGVGKTTSVINIAYEMFRAGKKVVVIDVDGQQNTSRFFVDVDTPYGTAEKTLITGAEPIIKPTRYSNIGVITAGNTMNSGIQEFLSLSENIQSEHVQTLINSIDCDYVLFDLPPALNEITNRILSVSNKVYVPIELGSFAIQGITNVMDAIAETETTFGGCFITKYDKHNPIDSEVVELLENNLDTSLFNTRIPNSKVIKNSISCRLTAAEYMFWTDAAKSYLNLLNEIIPTLED